MKIVRFLALFLATTVVILHSIVPHNHHCNLSPEEHAKEHQSANSLLDFIALGFHADHGEGQWEDFSSSNEVRVQLMTASIVESLDISPSEFLAHTESTEFIFGFRPGVLNRGLWDSDVLRGPPSVA